MSFFKKKRLLIATIIYWFLLVYIIAGMVWWFIALEQQNHQMTLFRMEQLRTGDAEYAPQTRQIFLEAHRKTAQYIGEGLTFLILFMTGAMFVYLPVRRQIKLQQQQQNFMMAVTHELKTPIAVAKLNLETLQKYKLDEQKQEKIIQSALYEINRLDSLANNILVSAQLESGSHQLAKTALDLSGLVESAAGDFRSRFPERVWEIRISPDLQISGDPLLLEILTNNLIENAVKYAPDRSRIEINLFQENGHTILQVKDQGPGIPHDERKNIFEIFYRIGNESTRTAQGTGLGLYLCKRIARDHHAHIDVSDNIPSGTVFTVIF
jgi:two-component system, OmpR family, sensor histidine kinase CiaH